MDYELPVIPYLKLKFVLSAKQDCNLPHIKGSMLRGAFGHALRRTVCVMKSKQTCKDCMLRQQCVFTRIFETFIEGEPPPFLKGIAEAPKPFILHAYDTKTDFKQGESFEFDITLLGRVCELYPYVIFAGQQMAERGLSVRRESFECSNTNWFKQVNGTFEERLLYDGESQCLCEAASPAIVNSDKQLSPPLTLQFLTPTRLKFRDQYTMDFTFRMLAFKMLRRVLEIAFFHVPDSQPDWEFHDLLARANKVNILKSNLHWEDWHRYSNRQQTEMDIGGFIGEMQLKGNIEPFTQLIRLSEMLHVGKGTSFGLGKMGVGEKLNKTKRM